VTKDVKTIKGFKTVGDRIRTTRGIAGQFGTGRPTGLEGTPAHPITDPGGNKADWREAAHPGTIEAGVDELPSAESGMGLLNIAASCRYVMEQTSASFE
jgi:hypothetical protein